MKKKYITLALGTLLSLSLLIIPVNMATVQTKPATEIKKPMITTKPIVNMAKEQLKPVTVVKNPVVVTKPIYNEATEQSKPVTVVKKPVVTTKLIANVAIVQTKLETVVKKSVVATKPIYNGAIIKKKLFDLGFFSTGKFVAINKYGPQGTSLFNYSTFVVGTGSVDIRLGIKANSPRVDKRYNTILNLILPTKGNALYSIISSPNLKSQTLKLDGRVVIIAVNKIEIAVTFGPTIK